MKAALLLATLSLTSCITMVQPVQPLIVERIYTVEPPETCGEVAEMGCWYEANPEVEGSI